MSLQYIIFASGYLRIGEQLSANDGYPKTEDSFN